MKSPVLPCPYCGEPNNRTTPAEGGDRAPQHGDGNMCTTCGELSIFHVVDGRMTVRKPNADEARSAARDPRIQAYSAAIKAVRSMGVNW